MSAIAVPVHARRSGWRQLIGFNMLTGILLGIGGWFLGHFIGGRITGANLTYFSEEAGQNDIAIMMGYLFGVIGFLIGLGFANYPVRRLLGHPVSLAERESEEYGLLRYFSLSTDHKVVAKQYMVGVGLFFAVGGLNAMLIRTELLQPNVHVFGPNQYLTLVGLHGSMMMGIMTSGILGPFANWLVPIMIGSRRMAFPRIESFTFWVLMAAAVVLLTTIFFGGFQTGWTGYQPLADQGTAGYDSYIGFFALVGLSMTLFGFNLVATIITMRAPGMTWSRLPIFVWASFATATLMLLAAPMLIAALLMGAMDRTVQTVFYVAGAGGSAYLFQNLFWVFGHPEVYILALPGFGIVLELLVVFARKPLWGYRLAVAGMLGVSLLSWFVWQHHLFVSGINADLRPFYMLSTELISLPTGFIFVCAMGTLWRGRIRFTVPMLF
ncbi:MAG TPA: cbb3-type cytochrome c oxidase subunit I, partial [Solirubrobacteraceae bacterium]|nr:cbb3-type cytochrome c oxidase subunit I [Solirubrobacteraceae bacterium]